MIVIVTENSLELKSVKIKVDNGKITENSLGLKSVKN